MNHLVRLNTARFDYEIVPLNQANKLRQLATEVQARGRRLTRLGIQIGQYLLEAKKYLNHGQFEDWCHSEAGLQPRRAQMYMSLAVFAMGESVAVTRLALTAACRLAAPSTPKQVVATVLGRVERGEKVTLGEIDDLLQRAKNGDASVLNVRSRDIEASKIRTLIDNVGAALEPPLIEELSAFFDHASPASLRMFRACLRARLAAG
ncbi:MAG: DUF3102 domain-containing protein [Xanthobacteraceae bacterium]|jgi:hypothetical protein